MPLFLNTHQEPAHKFLTRRQKTIKYVRNIFGCSSGGGNPDHSPEDPLDAYVYEVCEPREEFEITDSAPRLIILPESHFKAVWDLFIAGLVVFFIGATPVRIAFAPTATQTSFVTITKGWYWFDVFADICFLFDLLVNLRTAVRKPDGELEVASAALALTYARTWGFPDLLASVPLSLFLGPNTPGFSGGFSGGGGSSSSAVAGSISVRLLRGLRILRLLRVHRVSQTFLQLELATRINPGVFRLLRTVSLLVILWHWIACGYWFVSTIEGFCAWDRGALLLPGADGRPGANATTLLRTYAPVLSVDVQAPNGFNLCGADWAPWVGVARSGIWTQYVQSFFWAVMLTVGIGRDIVPQSNLETAFTLTVIVLGVGMYAVIIGGISSALAGMDSVYALRRHKLDRMEAFLRYHGVPRVVQERIRDYYDYIWSVNQSMVDEGEILSDLPDSLKSRIKVVMNKDGLRSIPLLQGIPFRAQLALIERMRQLIAIPGEFIVKEGELGEEFYILQRGVARVLHERGEFYREDILLFDMRDGAVFGENALYGHERGASVRALTYCHLLELDAQDFAEVCEASPQLAARMRALILEHQRHDHEMALAFNQAWNVGRAANKFKELLHDSRLAREHVYHHADSIDTDYDDDDTPQLPPPHNSPAAAPAAFGTPIANSDSHHCASASAAASAAAAATTADSPHIIGTATAPITVASPAHLAQETEAEGAAGSHTTASSSIPPSAAEAAEAAAGEQLDDAGASSSTPVAAAAAAAAMSGGGGACWHDDGTATTNAVAMGAACWHDDGTATTNAVAMGAASHDDGTATTNGVGGGEGGGGGGGSEGVAAQNSSSSAAAAATVTATTTSSNGGGGGGVGSETRPAVVVSSSSSGSGVLAAAPPALMIPVVVTTPDVAPAPSQQAAPAAAAAASSSLSPGGGGGASLGALSAAASQERSRYLRTVERRERRRSGAGQQFGIGVIKREVPSPRARPHQHGGHHTPTSVAAAGSFSPGGGGGAGGGGGGIIGGGRSPSSSPFQFAGRSPLATGAGDAPRRRRSPLAAPPPVVDSSSARDERPDEHDDDVLAVQQQQQQQQQ